MRSNRRVTFGALMAVAFATAPAVHAQQQLNYDRVIVFGDSLVDSGNAQILRARGGGDDPAPAAQGYFQGRFSDGYNFADYLSLGITGRPTTASEAGGLNFSVGGALAAEYADDASPSFAEQIGYFKASGATFDDKALVLVTLGGNDVRGELEAAAKGGTPTLAPAVLALTAGLGELYGLGARNFVVTGLPDIGQIPAVTSLGSSALVDLGTGLSAGLNAAFAGQVTGFNTRSGANAAFFDLFTFQKTIYADPAAYGLPTPLDTRTPCLIPPGSASGCADNVYFDAIHPTTGVHLAIAQGIARQIGVAAVPEPASWALMLFGFGLTAIALRHRRRSVHIALVR